MASTSKRKLENAEDQYPGFKKRPGTNAGLGHQYEINLTMLFLLQGTTNENISNFYLAANMNEAESFDDVVFKYKYKDNGEEKTKIIFLQAKHKEETKAKIPVNCLFFESKPYKDFLLKKYFDSYLKINKKFGRNQNCPIFGNKFKDAEFVIYTNASFLGVNDRIKMKKFKIKEDNILNLREKNNFYYELSYTSICNKIAEKPDVGEIKNFFSKFKLFVNQPNQKTLKEIIKQKIGLIYSMDENDRDIIYDKVYEKILGWSEEKNGIYLQKDNKFFTDAKKQLFKFKLDGHIKLHLDKIEKMDLRFEDENIERFKKIIDNKQIINIITNKRTALLINAKMYQTIKEKYKLENDDYIFLSLSCILSLQNNVIDIFKSEGNNLLVIECNDDTKGNVEDLYEQLLSIIESNNSKMIIIIAPEDDVLAKKFKNHFFGNAGYQEIMDETHCITDLTVESQNKLINKAQILFQGKEVNFGTLITDIEPKHLIDDELLLKLINNEKIEVGKSPFEMGDAASYYIDRTFVRHIEIKEDFKRETNFFVIYPNQDVNLNGNEDIVSISDVDEDFKKLCHNYKERNIHWLKKKDEKFIWKETHGSLSKLRRFVEENEQSIETYKPENIINIKDKVVIISDKPGMGKSTVLTKLVTETKTADPSLWVIRINLNDHTSDLSKINFDKNKDTAIDFLSDLFELTSPLEKKLFKYRMNSQGKIALLLDGFDEISPDYKEKVEELLKLLLNTKAEKLWITTRPLWKSELEDVLHVFSYILRPLSTDDQKIFITKFWSKKFIDLNLSIDDNHLNNYIEGLLKVLSNCISDNEMEFTGVPLQTRMLAEAFQDKFEEFYLSGYDKSNIPDQLNLVALYKLFIEKKLEIYSKEKKKEDLTKPSVMRDYRELRQSFILKHKLLALTILFSDHVVKNILSQRENGDLTCLINDFKDGTEQTGIINQIINDKPSFIHRTFAEYLAASWFAETEIQERQEVKDLLYEKMFDEENEVLFYFFNRILTMDEHGENKYRIHVAVLNEDKNTIRSLLADPEQSKFIINSRDKAGRTALHLAAAYDYFGIVEILLEFDADTSIADNIFGWRPLAYADKNSYWDIAGLLLEYGANDADMIEAKNNIKSYFKEYDTTIEKTLLHIAAEKGFTKFTEFLVRSGADVNACDTFGANVLCYAVENGNLYIVIYLIDQGTDVNGTDIQFIDGSSKYNIPVYLAIDTGNLDLLNILIKKGADINIVDSEGDTPLHSAIYYDTNLDVLKVLMEGGADFNIANDEGQTPLHLAAKFKKLDALELLIEKGADLCIADNDGSTSLDLMAYNDNLNVLTKVLAEKEADLNIPDNFGRISLHLAVYMEKLDVLKVLIENGADLNIIDHYFGQSTLHLAVYIDNLDILNLLIEKGADLNVVNNSGKTPLYLAVYCNKLNMIEVLIEKGANLNTADNYNDSLLHLAVKTNNSNLLKMLIKKRLDLNVVNNKHKTSLHLAIETKNFDIVKVLIEEGAYLNIADNSDITPFDLIAFRNNFDKLSKILSKTEVTLNIAVINCDIIPLHLAIVIDNSKIIKALITKGVDLNVTDNYFGKTPLQLAVCKNNSDVVELLIEKGVDLNIADNSGKTSLHLAVFLDNLKLIKILVERGADLNIADNFGKTALHFLSKNKNIQNLHIIKVLVENGADLNVTDNYGEAPLHLASKNNEFDNVEILIYQGADLNITTKKSGQTPLHLAIINNTKYDLAEILINKGTDLNVADNFGNTALHLAISKRYLTIVKQLINKGGDVNIANNFGKTPLHVAVHYVSLSSLQLLIKKGADLNRTDKDGRTPLNLAASNGAWDILNELIKAGANLNTTDNFGETPLFSVARSGKTDMLKILVDGEADIFARSNHNTVLHQAVSSNNEELIRMILEIIDDKLNGNPENKYESINVKDCEGDTPLMWAAKAGLTKVGKILLEHGANPNIQNNDDKTAFNLAAEGDNQEFLQLLRDQEEDM